MKFKNLFYSHSEHSLKINFWDFSLDAVFFALGFFAVLFHGLFGTIELMTFSCMFAVAAFFVCPPKTPASLCPLFVLTAFVSVNFICFHGLWQSTVTELSRWILLISVCLCCLSQFGKKLFLGFFYGITFSALLGICAFFKIIPRELFGFQLAASIDGTLELFSVFGYSNTAALFFGSAFFLALSLFRGEKTPRNVYCAVGLNLFALLLTRSRFAIIFFAFSICAYIAARKSKLKLFFVIFSIFSVAVVTAAVFAPRLLGSTIISRIIYLTDAARAFKPFGIGFGNWAETKYSVQTAIYSTDYLHNGYAQLLLEGGIHIFAAFAVFAVLHLKSVYKDGCIFALSLFIFLHTFVDIDMAYGALYILLGYCVSYDACTLSVKKLFKPFFGIGIATLVAISGLSAYELFTPVSVDFYTQRLNSDNITVAETAELYRGAEEVADSESMYVFSLLWLEKAPRSQDAFNAVYNSIEKKYAATLDENYLTVSRSALYKKKNIANATMNPLCKYLSKNKFIELP